MSGPIDIAVDLGAVPPSLPKLVSFREFAARPEPVPPQVIHGILHQGGKMILSGTSKSNKSWSLLDLAISVASGQEWWGHRCEKLPVAYLNFELHPWAMQQRLGALCLARPECRNIGDSLFLWNLRGHNADISVLRPQLETELARQPFGLIILDPVYKLLGNRDENANGEIANLMNEFEALAQKTGAAIVIAHHFAKGDSSAKAAIDRSSGAGVWTRDPDSLVTLTPHEEDRCFTVNLTLRNLPMAPEFVLEWDYPLMKVAKDLNPEALRRTHGRKKVCTDKEFIDQFISETPSSRATIIAKAAEQDISTPTADRYLKRLVEAGLIGSGNGVYWKKQG
ncbi:MAG: AAA family ATPase [Verrucomicrobiota bacterium]